MTGVSELLARKCPVNENSVLQPSTILSIIKLFKHKTDYNKTYSANGKLKIPIFKTFLLPLFSLPLTPILSTPPPLNARQLPSSSFKFYNAGGIHGLWWSLTWVASLFISLIHKRNHIKITARMASFVVSHLASFRLFDRKSENCA